MSWSDLNNYFFFIAWNPIKIACRIPQSISHDNYFIHSFCYLIKTLISLYLSVDSISPTLSQYLTWKHGDFIRWINWNRIRNILRVLLRSYGSRFWNRHKSNHTQCSLTGYISYNMFETYVYLVFYVDKYYLSGLTLVGIDFQTLDLPGHRKYFENTTHFTSKFLVSTTVNNHKEKGLKNISHFNF